MFWVFSCFLRVDFFALLLIITIRSKSIYPCVNSSLFHQNRYACFQLPSLSGSELTIGRFLLY